MTSEFLTPIKLYQKQLATNGYQHDAQQEAVIDILDHIFLQIMHNENRGFTEKLFSSFKHREPVKGLYLWGGVGIGKTWMMDIFYSCLPEHLKLRLHFHQFMQRIHLELKQLQGNSDPLKIIARRIAKQTRVLCFDEFFVSDIADAMILAGLFQALFSQGVSLITTSNTEPDNLYKNGLQRERFIPAIQLINKHTEVIHLLSSQDYRLRKLTNAGVFYSPINENTRMQMRERFEDLAGQHWKTNELVIIQGRAIPTVRIAAGVVWFSFQDLCTIPRSQLDYLEIAKSFHTILLSNVPKISAHQDNLILYLINLIDILYDTQTKLIMSSQVSLEDIYLEGRFKFEFARTKSRLIEMQSVEYLQTPHNSMVPGTTF